MFIALKNAYLCPGDDNGEHVVDDPRRCQCGSSNLVPLELILSKLIKEKEKDERPYDGLCADVPLIQEMFRA